MNLNTIFSNYLIILWLFLIITKWIEIFMNITKFYYLTIIYAGALLLPNRRALHVLLVYVVSSLFSRRYWCFLSFFSFALCLDLGLWSLLVVLWYICLSRKIYICIWCNVSTPITVYMDKYKNFVIFVNILMNFKIISHNVTIW